MSNCQKEAQETRRTFGELGGTAYSLQDRLEKLSKEALRCQVLRSVHFFLSFTSDSILMKNSMFFLLGGCHQKEPTLTTSHKLLIGGQLSDFPGVPHHVPKVSAIYHELGGSCLHTPIIHTISNPPHSSIVLPSHPCPFLPNRCDDPVPNGSCVCWLVCLIHLNSHSLNLSESPGRSPIARSLGLGLIFTNQLYLEAVHSHLI